jgi:hypothetical protein
MSGVAAQRARYRIDLTFRLHGMAGNARAKAWFFDLPVQRATHDGWEELLSRIFYDANVGMQRSAPWDQNWLRLDGFRASAVDVATMLAWDGLATNERAAVHMPWFLSDSAMVWEPAAC